MPMDLWMKAQAKAEAIFNVNRLSLEDQAAFLQRLSHYIENGYSLMEALRMLSWQSKWETYANQTSIKLQEGHVLDQALQHVGFHSKITSYLYFARYNGNLELSLKQCGAMIQRQIGYMKQLKQASRYPLVLFFLFCILLYFVKNSLFPSFSLLFTSNNQSTLTAIAMTVINVLFQILFISAVATPIIIAVYWIIKRYFLISKQVNIIQKLPIIQHYASLHISCLFSVHISSLLASGMPIKEALHTIRNQSQLPILAYYASIIISELEKGIMITNIFPALQLFKNELTYIFQKNANTAALEKDLHLYAESLMEQLQTSIKRWISIIQPLFFLFMAGLIILVYLSLLLPTFQLINSI